MLINNIILYKKEIIMDGSKWYGKVATVIFYGCMFILVLFPALNQSRSMPLIVITAIFQGIALIGYGNWFIKMLREN